MRTRETIPSPLTEDIDRRTLPTIEAQESIISHVDAFLSDIEPGSSIDLSLKDVRFGYVDEGVVEITADGNVVGRVGAGESFAMPAGAGAAGLANASDDVPAKVVTFAMR